MSIFLFRHAETAWTLTGQHTGKTELELTPRGEAEARAAGAFFVRLLEGRSLTRIYVSPRRRARHTAELALGTPTPVVSELLAEVDYGDYEGLTKQRIFELSPSWNIWEHGCPGGETVEQAGARADEFQRTCLAGHEGESVCVVSHGHFLRVLAARLLGLEPRQGRLFDIDTASIAELVQKGDRLALARWNQRS